MGSQNNKRMTARIQKAAVDQAIIDGLSLDTIKTDYPYLKEGVELYAQQATKPLERVGSASATQCRRVKPAIL